jgi:CubicO group peptidase (beta-lactamase class C family)
MKVTSSMVRATGPALLAVAVGFVAVGPELVAQAAPRAALLTRIDSIVAAEMARNQNVGLSVGVEWRGDLVLARGYGLADLELSVPATAETVYRIGSVTKQFTVAAILQLTEQGKLSLDAELTTLLPGYPSQGNRVTLQHLLTHTSGIKSYTSLGPKFWSAAARQDLGNEEMLALFKDEPFDFAPGAKYLYNNSAYFLLGVIIERVTGTPYPTYLEERILAPLGLRATSYCDERRVLPHRAQGYEVRDGRVVNDDAISMNTPGAAGAMCSTVLDLLAWRRALDGNRVVSATSRDRMRTSQVAVNDSVGYGYGLVIARPGGRRLISHGGGINGFSAYLGHYPDDSLTLAVLTNNGGGRAPQLAQLIAKTLLEPQ